MSNGFVNGPRCVCGKVIFHSRQQAKAAARRVQTRGKRPYICDLAPDGGDTVWHLGELGPAVKAGRATRRQVYVRRDGEVEARQKVGTRAKRYCETCGGKGYEYSHRRTVAVKDDHEWCPCNGTLSCSSCHDWLHRHPLDARALGLMVSRYVDEPAKVPVRLRGGWVMLHCDGSVTPLRQDQVELEHGTPTLVG